MAWVSDAFVQNNGCFYVSALSVAALVQNPEEIASVGQTDLHFPQ